MATKPLTTEQKQALALFRKRLGGVSKEKHERLKHQVTLRKAIRDFLARQPATIPEIASALARPTDEVLWQVMGMKKYGRVREAGDSGWYARYGLIELETDAAAGEV